MSFRYIRNHKDHTATKCESIADLDLTLPKFKKSLKSLQTMLDQHKITDYKILIPEGSKHQLIEMFQYVWDLELLEYKDELHKR